MDKTTTVGAYTDAALLELAQRVGTLVCAAEALITQTVGSQDRRDRLLAHQAQEAVDDVRGFLANIRGLGFLG